MTADTPSPEPIPDEAPARKPPPRIWLFAPFVLIVVALMACGGFWVFLSSRVGAGIEARAEALRQAGYVVELEDRRITGFPFRMKVVYGQARIASPSGWQLGAPAFAAEANLYNLGHWVVVAPEGLTFTRPQGGPVTLKGEALRGSIVQTKAGPWRIVLQARKAQFAPAPGARPFSLASADLVEFYLKPASDPAQGLFLFRVDGGKGQQGALLGQIAGDQPVSIALEGRITHTGAFHGADWGQSVRAWRLAGGVLDGVQGTASAGVFAAKSANGTLGVGSDGRLVGALPMELRQAGHALTALAETAAVEEGAAQSAAAVAAARAQGEAATVNLVFQAGVMTFGPVKLGPSPKVG